ncbi:YqgQ family protein [Sporosarcina sp. FSL K6-1522]|uniref:YqgQ family protein n=1 Tax=Sporosarcina sp. FSL K6-1522 TaxID=2921554 RepID=UPI00315A2B69
MNDYFSVIQLLKRFGIYVYMGDKKSDIEMMQTEVKDLFDSGLIPQDVYLQAILLLRKELSNI